MLVSGRILEGVASALQGVEGFRGYVVLENAPYPIVMVDRVTNTPDPTKDPAHTSCFKFEVAIAVIDNSSTPAKSIELSEQVFSILDNNNASLMGRGGLNLDERYEVQTIKLTSSDIVFVNTETGSEFVTTMTFFIQVWDNAAEEIT